MRVMQNERDDCSKSKELATDMTLEEIDRIVLNKTVNKRKNLAFVLVLDKTSRFGLAD